jgi:hypothetical protein
MRVPAIVLTLACLLLAACMPARLKPAEEASTLPNAPLAAVTEQDGVRMVVEPGAWSANPENLESRILPLKVSITNNNSRPVRVRYSDFTLEGNGLRYTPLPPIEIRGRVTETADRPVYVPSWRSPFYSPFEPRFSHYHFHVAPWYAPYYMGMSAWPRPWRYDPFYYDTYYPRWNVNLPTSEMIELAIPEGVIEPGGRVSGFLYFQPISGDLERVTFKAQLMDGNGGQRLGALELPFDVS